MKPDCKYNGNLVITRKYSLASSDRTITHLFSHWLFKPSIKVVKMNYISNIY